MKLIILTDIYEQIKNIVYETKLETGVTLFGEKEGDNFRILGIAGPGPNAVHEECSFAGNEDYATTIFEGLKKEKPNLRHIGELHAHPMGMSWLSRTDRETVKEILKEYEEFVAGVILRIKMPDYRWPGLAEGGGCLRQRRARILNIFPVYFSWEKPEGQKMEVALEGQENSRRWFRFGRKRGR